MSVSVVRHAHMRGFALLAFATIVLLLAMVPQHAAAAVLIERVSISNASAQGNNLSHRPFVSGDGRYVVFESLATNLVPGDDNGYRDIFVRDRQTGTTTRVSVATGGAQATGGDSRYPSISADGRHVAFESEATNLVGGDTNDKPDIFIRDLQTGTTTRVSVPLGGGNTDNGSWAPSISADGRYVAFESAATNLVSSDVNGHTDIFVRDRRVAKTVRVSVQDGTGLHGNGDSSAASISADGLRVAFVSEASNLVGKDVDNNSVPDVFVRDRQAGVTTRVSVATDGAEANQSSSGPRISADGRYVAFESGATTLVTADTNGSNDIFVHDLQMGATKRVSVTNAGGQANSYSGNPPGISGDGRYVAFKSDATNLVSGDTNGYDDIFVRDTVLNTTRRVNVTGTGVQGDADCTYPSISADGRHVVFGAYAANLVPGDTNDSGDILVYTAPSSVLRVADRTRFSTAVAVAKAGYPDWAGVKHVIIASGDDRAAADPLAASGLCWAYDAPMLLVSAARTPDEVKAAVQQIVAKNGPITLHVVGGPVSVPAARLAELVAAGGGSGKVTIDRVLSTGGRYDMSAAIARRMKSVAASDPGKTMPPVALFANGADATKFFDALALSPISAGNGAPILLVTATSVPPATAAVVGELAPTTKIVGGGPNTVSEAVRTQLGATRWSGQSRYDTAIAIADGAIANGWLLRSYVGLAAKLPDALTGGGFVGQRKGVLLLTDGANLTPVTKNWLTARKLFVAEVYLFGGPLSISEAVKTQVGNALQ